MALCGYCRAVDFSALPAHPRWDQFCRAFDDSQMNVFKIKQEDRETTPYSELGVSWQDSLDSLAESAALNCSLCTIVQTAVENWNDRRSAGKNRKSLHKALGSQYDFDLPNKRLFVTQRFGRGPGFVVFIPCSDDTALLLGSVTFTADEASPLARELRLRPFCEDSGSPKALRVVSSWLENCQENHEKCYHGHTTLPSRVLAVGCIGDGSIKLIEPDAGIVEKYASLSHCWGIVPMLTTTHTSRYAHMSGIFVTDLPKTFRDAVTVTRYLGIPYLWIDSLCIIQDDPQDWARESSRMMEVYSNAYVVIAANHASDSAGGCFHVRRSRISASLRIPGIGLVHVQLGANSDEFLYHNSEFSNEPLAKRAWALQERFLAARTIHYNTEQMYFECRHGLVGEDGCKSDRRYCDLSPGMNHRYSARKALQIWSSIIWTYGERYLTKPTDRFPAMSGIASTLGCLLKDEYVAGLWSRVMVQGMAWQGLWRPQPQPIDEYIGPSWSWASFQGIAALDTKSNWRSIAMIEDWHVELTHPDDPYGRVNSASVRVRGPITQLTQSMIPVRDDDERLERSGIRLERRFCTKYSGEGNGIRLSLDNEDLNASGQWEEMDIKVLLLGGHGEELPISQREIEGEESESKKDKRKERFLFSQGFGLAMTSTNVNGAIYMKRVGHVILDSNQVERLGQTEEDWHTVTII